MAERNFDTVECLGRKKRMLNGSFKPNGASAIDNTLNQGEGFTVAYTTTGVYTVTFSDKYGKCQRHASSGNAHAGRGGRFVRSGHGQDADHPRVRPWQQHASRYHCGHEYAH